MKNEARILEKGVEIKVGDPEHVYTINAVEYVPVTFINEFCDYSRTSIRGLYNKGKVDKRAFMKISNLQFVRRDYIPALQMLYNHPDKYSRQKFMIDMYYKKVDIKK